MTGIYVYTNKANEKQYVGKSAYIEERKKGHLHKARGGDDTHFHNALRKYGEDGFDFEILEQCPEELLDERERFYIKKLNTTYPNGYNLTEGGEGGDMFKKRTPEQMAETKRKMSESHRGKKHTPEEIKKMSESQKGKPRPHSEKWKSWNRGKKMTEDFRRKISEAGSGEKNPMFGKKQSDLCREVNSRIHRGQTPANKGKHIVWDDKGKRKFHYE